MTELQKKSTLENMSKHNVRVVKRGKVHTVDLVPYIDGSYGAYLNYDETHVLDFTAYQVKSIVGKRIVLS